MAWAVIAVLAHNLARWTGQLGLCDPTPRTSRTIRRWLLALPGRLTRTARRWTLHLPARWPWRRQLIEVLTRIGRCPRPDHSPTVASPPPGGVGLPTFAAGERLTVLATASRRICERARRRLLGA